MPDPLQTTVAIACKSGLLAVAAAVLIGCATSKASKSAADEEPNFFGDYNIEEIMQTGDDALRAEEYDRAIFIYMQAVELEESADVWYRVGVTKMRLDDRTFAWRAFNRAVELDPEHAPSYEELGLLYMGMGQPEAAKDALIKATQLDNNRWRAYNALGVMEDVNKQYTSAVGFYMTALESFPDSAMLMNNIGYSYYLAGDLQNATHWFDAAIQAESDYAPAVKNMGLLYARQGWYDEAVNTFKRVVEAPQAYNDVGYIALRNGDFLEASNLLTEAVRLSPVYYEIAYQNLERVRTELERAERRGKNQALAENMSEIVFPDNHEQKTRKVMPQALNIRSAPSSDAEIVSYLKTGDEVQIVLSQPGWSFISYRARTGGEELTGWVNTRYLLDDGQTVEQRISRDMVGSQIAVDTRDTAQLELPPLAPTVMPPQESTTAPATSDSGVTLPIVEDTSIDNVAEMPIDLSALQNN